MTGPLRVLLAGWDGLGAQDHQRDMFWPAFVRHPGFEVVGVVGTGERDARAATETGLPLLADPGTAITDLDAAVVSVCLRGEHRQQVIEASLRGGAHVLVDRPLADTVEQAEALAALADETGRRCVPAYFHRFHPRLRAAASAIAGGRVGLPWNVQADFFVSGGRAVPEGEIANFAGFAVDNVLTLVGQPVTQAHAFAAPAFGTDEGGAPADDLAVLLLDHAHGLTSTIVVGRRPNPGGAERLINRYRVSGSGGTLLVDAAAPGVVVEDREKPLADPWRPDLLAALLDEVHAVASGARPTLGVSNGVDTVRVLAAVAASLRSGQPEPVGPAHGGT